MTNNSNDETAIDAQMYFAVLPEWVLYLPISANAVRVYCCLRRFADNSTGECYPSRKLLAKRARISVVTLDRCIKELVDFEAVKVRKRKNNAGDWSSNLYTVMSYPQSYQGVANKLGIPLLKNNMTGSHKTQARTRTITNQKQELPDYASIEQQQEMSMGSALFHTGANITEVEYQARDAYGKVRQSMIDTFLALCSLHKVTPEEGKCSKTI